MFFILCDNREILFFMKVYRYSEGFSNQRFAKFFDGSILKEV